MISMKAEGIAVGGMAGAMVLLSTLDAYVTTKIVVHGGGTELNPFMRSLLEHSVTEFWLLKVVGSALAALLLVQVYKRVPYAAVIAFIGCLVALAFICGWNLVQILGIEQNS